MDREPSASNTDPVPYLIENILFREDGLVPVLGDESERFVQLVVLQQSST